MIPIWVGKIVAKRVIKAIKYKIDLKKIDKYVNKPNELDSKVRDLENANVIISKQLEISNKKLDKYGKYTEELEKEVATLKKDSHPSQEFICCRKCGCEIAKTKIKKGEK